MTMEGDYRRDYAQKRWMDDLRREAESVLEHDRRLRPDTRVALERAVECLRRDSDHIVAVWD